jgi:hypothetical protein
MNGIYQDYYDFIRVAFLLQMRPWNCHRKSDSAYTHASLGGGHHAIPPNACFNEHWYMKGIWMVYERHISWGGLLLLGGTLPGLPGLPSAPGRFGPGTSANLFGFDHRKSTNTRLGPAKVPQPGVDLIHMAAPARSLARAVSTPEFEGLLLSRSILASVWNGRRGIAMKKARKERHPPKKVLCPTDVESRDRRGFIQQMIMSYE